MWIGTLRLLVAPTADTHKILSQTHHIFMEVRGHIVIVTRITECVYKTRENGLHHISKHVESKFMEKFLSALFSVFTIVPDETVYLVFDT